MATAELAPRSGRGTAPRHRSAWARHQELLRELVRRDLRARYRGSALGIAWSLLNPLVYMVIYTVVFSTLMRFPLTGAPYPVFLLSGLLAWNFFTQALTGSVNSVLGNANLVKKVAFPWILLTIAAVLSAFVNYLISLALLLPLMLLYHVPLAASLVLLPVLVLLTLVLASGISLVVAAGNVYFRDIEYLVVIALQVLFFLTPIIYSIDLINTRVAASKNPLAHYAKFFFDINPLTGLITAFQDVIAFHRWPLNWGGLAYSTLVAAVALALGIIVFGRLQARFAEEL